MQLVAAREAEALAYGPVPEPIRDTWNQAAVMLGRLGGSKGGTAWAAKLSKVRRTEIAKTAAAKCWEAKRVPQSGKV